MNNKGKLIRLLIAIIIPLLAAVFIANYSYNWEVYRNKFTDDYLQKESTSEDSINNFIEFDSYLYEEKPYLIHQYKNEEGKVLFEFKIIRTISLQDDEPTFVNYKFFIYNVDYESLVHITNDEVKENTPRDINFKVSLIFSDRSPRTIFLQDTSFQDFQALPEYNHKGEKSLYKVKYNTIGGLDIPNDLKIMVYQGELKYDEDTHEVTPKDIDEFTEFINLDVDDFTFDADDLSLDDFVNGFDKDVLKAGFGSYIFKKKIWWQVIVTLVTVSIITFSFLIVWDYEQQEKKETNKRK